MRILKTICVGACIAAGGGAALADDAAALLGERQLAVSLDERCGLFTQAQRSALDAARLQARSALLRGGHTIAALSDYTARVEARAAQEDCRSAEVADLAGRVTGAFEAWLRVPSVVFPGDVFDWSASRLTDAAEASWSVLQDTGAVRIGMSTYDDKSRFTLAVPQAASHAVAAVLVLRDMQREPALYDPTVGGAFPAPAGAAWARWTPPSYAKSLTWARGRGDAAATATLAGSREGSVFYFPDSAAEALAARDPREAARIELLDRRGSIIATHYFEVGDFGAALAFLRASELRKAES